MAWAEHPEHPHITSRLVSACIWINLVQDAVAAIAGTLPDARMLFGRIEAGMAA